MATDPTLLDYLDAGRRRRPDQVAVEDPGIAEITYRSLDTLTDRLRDRLRAFGVRRGDRVGICVRKSVDSIASIFGVQKCGAAHVPVDATAPAARNAFIFENCSVRAAIVEASLVDALRAALGENARLVRVLSLDFEAGPYPSSRHSRKQTPSTQRQWGPR